MEIRTDTMNDEDEMSSTKTYYISSGQMIDHVHSYPMAILLFHSKLSIDRVGKGSAF